MANTRKPLARGLITPERLADLVPGMVLRLHLPVSGGKYWNWYDVRYVGHTDKLLRVVDRPDDDRGISYPFSGIGIIATQLGTFSPAYICIRDEELGLRRVG